MKFILCFASVIIKHVVRSLFVCYKLVRSDLSTIWDVSFVKIG